MVHNSSLDEEKNVSAVYVEEKHERRASVVESLHELPDPDAGKSDEERAAIVRPPLQTILSNQH